ncbi:protein-glutamine gamma-glutamyltransferase 4-like [Dendronephthya gigantea]|uniref:protein-glutamine gamma-glutamyltransferase 4-like n=1 Tax=Dendronephthya gigantea TaxID=151771 RepID=UPI00106D5D3E|nr:protein-glutamine gamma-glutamyltransferase 4-like [Dendronephthya gigantea]
MCYSFLHFFDFCYKLIFGPPQKEKPSGPKTAGHHSGYKHVKDIGVECDLFIEKNTKRHHTDEYINRSLVLRRGELFFLGMKFKGLTFSGIMHVKLRFSLEREYLKSNKMNVATIGIADDINYEAWGMVVVEKDHTECNIVVKVMIPVTAAIGRYKVSVLLPSSSSFVFLNEFEIIALANAWNKDDDVYLEEEELREEYVLNDVGMIFRGNASNGVRGISGTHWQFGQFDENVLDCVLLLLEKDKRVEKQPLRSYRNQNSVVWLARILSAVLNCQQDDGLLVGNWSGNYKDGKAPSSWLGSSDIFREYYKTNQPVKYGQCWVFSGVMTTALRALGIPARCITNFDSAHDTDESMTIDVIESEDGSPMEDISNDSIWNFHVWNEIWTRRKDLLAKYDGWNAVDCTPQELSSQLFQMGPAPLTAIRDGEIFVPYDTGFVFSECNADYVKWIASKDENGAIALEEASYRNKTYIGKYISTKMVGEDKREDITHLYKYSEGSDDERTAFQTAFKFAQGSENRKALLNKKCEENDIEIDLVMHQGQGAMIQNGTDISCTVQVRNTAQRASTVNMTAVISTIEYTGRIKALVKRVKLEDLKVNVGQCVKREFVVKADEYVKKLSDLNFMKIVAIAKVQETKKQFVEDYKIQLFHAECISVKFLDPVEAGHLTRVEITFTNRLNVNMTNLVYSVSGKGLTVLQVQQSGNVGILEVERVIFRLIPFKAGKHTLCVDIDSVQVKDLKCFVEVQCY